MSSRLGELGTARPCRTHRIPRHMTIGAFCCHDSKLVVRSAWRSASAPLGERKGRLRQLLPESTARVRADTRAGWRGHTRQSGPSPRAPSPSSDPRVGPRTYPPQKPKDQSRDGRTARGEKQHRRVEPVRRRSVGARTPPAAVPLAPSGTARRPDTAGRRAGRRRGR